MKLIPQNRLGVIENDPRVDYVEPDGVARAIAQTLPWGINKIDADLSPTTLAGNGSGAVSNVNAYIIDSGISNHRNLNKVGHVNFAGGKNDDCNGHDTHAAGTVAAKDDANDVVGVAPGAPLYSVKVLGCGGTGSWSGIIKGVDWVTGHDSKGLPKVAIMSLGGGGALYLSSNTGAIPTTVEGALKSAVKDYGTVSKDGRAILLEYVGGF